MLEGCVQLLVVVFCPSVLLTGPSIWATAHVINQMEISCGGTGSVIDTVGVFLLGSVLLTLDWCPNSMSQSVYRSEHMA